MNKNIMPHEIKLSDSFINENDWEETYKSPIDMIVSQMSSEFDRMAENQLLLRVNQAVDFYVDKAELLKALQYDRNQYETGYLAAKKKYQRPKGKWLRMSNLSEEEDDRYKCSHCGNVIHYKDKMNLYTFNGWCGRCGGDNRRKMEVEE